MLLKIILKILRDLESSNFSLVPRSGYYVGTTYTSYNGLLIEIDNNFMYKFGNLRNPFFGILISHNDIDIFDGKIEEDAIFNLSILYNLHFTYNELIFLREYVSNHQGMVRFISLSSKQIDSYTEDDVI